MCKMNDKNKEKCPICSKEPRIIFETTKRIYFKCKFCSCEFIIMKEV